LHLRLAATDDHQLSSGRDDLRGYLAGDVQALLVHQARDHREQRAATFRQAELAAHVPRVEAAVAAPARAEAHRQRGVDRRNPAVIDAVDDAAEVALRRTPPEQPVQAAAFLRPHDLRRIADADGVDAGGVDDAGPQEGQAAMAFHVGHVLARHADAAGDAARAHALVRPVVDGARAGGAAPAPLHAG